MVCSLFSWQNWSLFLWECRVEYSNCECRVVESHAQNISAVSYILVSEICCGSNKMEQLLTQHKFPCKSWGQCFWADSLLISGTSPGWPIRRTLQYQTTSLGATLKARYKKHIQPILLLLNGEFWGIFQGSLRKCYMLWQPLHHDCRSVLNNMVVTYKMSYLNSNYSDDFSRTRNAPNSVNKIFPLCLETLFHFKNHQVFWCTL